MPGNPDDPSRVCSADLAGPWHPGPQSGNLVRYTTMTARPEHRQSTWTRPDERTVIGWREIIAIPDWHIPALRVKIDTGAKTSAIDVKDVQTISRDHVRFHVVLHGKRRDVARAVEARVIRWTRVRSSNGQLDERPVVAVPVRIGPVVKRVEFSLVCRQHMICRGLLGRSALEGDFLVDCHRTYLLGRRTRKKKHPPGAEPRPKHKTQGHGR
jgi:hypothetical protein